MAVGAAVYLGIRQTAIQRNQTKIQELSLRADLFDRRYSVLERTGKFIQEIFWSAYDPDKDVYDLNKDTTRIFLMAAGESRFLFKINVCKELRDIHKKSVELDTLKKIMEHTFLVENHYGDGNPAKKANAINWFGERMATLPELFSEMSIESEISIKSDSK